MPEVVTFVDYRPPARFDAIPFTEVRIEEAATADGTYTLIDTVTLTPVDSDPSDPAERSFTTELGTALDYWYRVRFADASGDTSQPTTPIQNVAGATVPSVVAYATVEELLRVLTIRGTPSEAQIDAAQRALDAAAFEIDREIGRTTPYDNPPALAVQVNLERAVEHWQQQSSPFAVIGLGDSPIIAATNSWERHAHKLAPLKERFGMA